MRKHSLFLIPFLLLSLSCEVAEDVYEFVFPPFGGTPEWAIMGNGPSACEGGCEGYMLFPSGVQPSSNPVYDNKPDANGYYHVKLNWNSEYYPYFSVAGLGTPVRDRYVTPQGRHLLYFTFDSNFTWELGSGAVFIENFFNPFGSDRSSSGTALPIRTTQLQMQQYAGEILNIVQGTTLYGTYDEDLDMVWAKRIVGPIPPEAKGDTITLYMDVFWEANELPSHISSAKFIVE